ncbi:hypothetical protein CHS0354_038093 [Potamilus streckersoni]|uniref:EF-hand domain-containing protein n=1 Tax=Potamilus streckersoni TaxID=2493646 RepID=A0AAE0SSI9_9BIVA|nr:hypothetical protein CHS0354_038093 [Potamilus streckersoni]
MERRLLNCVVLITFWFALSAGHAGDHAHPHQDQAPPTSFNDPKVAQDQAHIKEHMKDEINMNKQMTPQEMEFHYFRIHDVNNDTQLDGIEILQAMSHMIPPPELTFTEKVGKSDEQIEAMKKDRQEGMLKYYIDIIDRVLQIDDLDHNGYLSYPEYVRARRRDEVIVQQQMMQQQQHMMHQEMMAQQRQFEEFQQWQRMQQQMQQQKGGNQVQTQGQGGQGMMPPPAQGQAQYQIPSVQQTKTQ